jgi:lambda family phage portal protein
MRLAKTRILGEDGKPWRPSASQLQALQRVSGGDDPFKGASNTRRAGAMFNPSFGSPDADHIPVMAEMRARSQHTVRNNPLGAGAIDTLVVNCVGTGLVAQPNVDTDVLGISEDEAAQLNKDIKREWELGTNTIECDANRINTMGQLQQLAFRSSLVSGDLLTTMPMFARAGSPYSTKVQIIESDRVENPNFQLNMEHLIAGVETDLNFAPARYHVRRAHPGGTFFIPSGSYLKWDTVEAFGAKTGRRIAWLLYEQLRPGQTRGIPYLSTVIEQLHQIERYTDCELMAAVVGGSFTVFITTPDGQGAKPLASIPFDGDDNDLSAYDEADISLDYGSVARLRPGDSIETAAPGRPNQAFADFVKSIIEQIGAGIGIPYELLVKHFTSSYSASRAALLEAWKYFRVRRARFADGWLLPIYEAFLTEAVLRGRLLAPGFIDPLKRSAYLRVSWIGPAPGQLDPTKEVQAARERIGLNISTVERETAEITGDDWQAVARQRAREVDTFKKLGIEFNPLAVPAGKYTLPTQSNEGGTGSATDPGSEPGG